jgi:hypothetical protein
VTSLRRSLVVVVCFNFITLGKCNVIGLSHSKIHLNLETDYFIHSDSVSVPETVEWAVPELVEWADSEIHLKLDTDYFIHSDSVWHSHSKKG